MPHAAANPNAPKRRHRKRKRRVSVSSSSSSSSSSEGSDSDAEQQTAAVKPQQPQLIKKPVAQVVEKDEKSSRSSSSSSSDSSSSESESDSDSSSSDESSGGRNVARSAAVARATAQNAQAAKTFPRQQSPSPPPPPTEIPSFLNSENEKEQELMKERFRKFWLASVADGFKDDLEEIQKEPNLGQSRLALLIDSLATGADVFTQKNENGVSEMDIVLN
ncbi:hypothetical protein FA15DRAFT_753294 [Coprinopsis marcescibilis]|uniref:Ribosome assembly protein 3 n=1 Tax=Coprinopsis marcescibilis TaxID=230819 RepID=A0A5C3L7C8_COPMA|nr:hypothetical protein FA15DRAFT_753294 [Coprinopsis marcescibilis]